MEKLELKHLAGYLPYGLKMKYTGNGKPFRGTQDIETLTISNIELLMFSINRKPILRPLSDLTKEIEVNREKFVPIDFLNKRCLGLTKYQLKEIQGDQYLLATYTENYNCLNENTAKDFLFEWYFDIYGLIEKGLAIDINTLK